MKLARRTEPRTVELRLDAHEHALFDKLEGSRSDIATAQLCARYLIKKGWHDPPYFRRGSTYIQQIAFTTTMIVAYCRPFVVGKGNIKFPKRLVQFTKEQNELHNRMIALRNQEHAHTDVSTYVVTPFKGAISSIQTLRATYFDPDEITIFLEMTSGLNGRIEMRMEEIRSGAAREWRLFERLTLGTVMTLVFGYGSNMDDGQMDIRCPDRVKVGNAVLRNHRLIFPRLSNRRDCGVASIEPANGQEVWGVVHELNAKDLESLDRSEGYRADRAIDRNGYNRVSVTVEIDGLPTVVETYVAVATPNPPAPNAIYLDHIRNGAHQHCLPAEYQAFLAGLQF